LKRRFCAGLGVRGGGEPKVREGGPISAFTSSGSKIGQGERQAFSMELLSVPRKGAS